jgi:hypothetical protein
MRYLDKRMIVAVSLALIIGSGGAASAQDDSDPNRLTKYKAWMGLGAGEIVLGMATFNPVGVGIGVGTLARGTYEHRKHRLAGEAAAASATANVTQPEALVAVPDRPGYFYYPSNPNQLYFSASAVAASEPMQAKIPEPARIKVLIVNKAKDGRTIRYTVSGTPYEIPPGYMQALDTPAGSVIAYDRGDKVGTERFVLTAGNYEFRTADQGWRFYASTPSTATVAKAKETVKPAEDQKPAVAVR